MKPAVFAIFGVGGDLSRRKLLPALYNLHLNHSLPENFAIVGLARNCDLESFHGNVRAAIEEFSRTPIQDGKDWDAFTSHVHFLCGDFGEEQLYKDLSAFIAEQEKEWDDKA